jgi:hypothetical protein
MTDDTEPTPVAHMHGSAEHSHVHGDIEHVHEVEGEHPVQDPTSGHVPDPAIEAFVTTITIAVAHTPDVGPYETVKQISRLLEGQGIRGVVAGVASVELRGPGGLVGL